MLRHLRYRTPELFQACGQILSFVAMWRLAVSSGLEIRGDLSAAVAIVGTFSFLFTFSMDKSLIIALQRNDGSSEQYRDLLSFAAMAVPLAAVIFLLVPQLQHGTLKLPIFCLMLGSTLAFEFGQAVNIGSGRLHLAFANRIITPSVLFIAFSLPIGHSWKPGQAIYVLLLGQLASTLTAACQTWRFWTPGFRGLVRRPLNSLGAHGALSLALVCSRLDFLVGPHYLSRTTFGSYAVAASVGQAILFVSGGIAMRNYTQPRASQRNDYLFIAIVCAVGAVTGPRFLHLLYNNLNSSVDFACLLLIISGGFAGLAQGQVSRLVSRGKHIYVMVVCSGSGTAFVLGVSLLGSQLRLTTFALIALLLNVATFMAFLPARHVYEKLRTRKQKFATQGPAD